VSQNFKSDSFDNLTDNENYLEKEAIAFFINSVLPTPIGVGRTPLKNEKKVEK
jgi:hypothetical protein